MREMNCTMNNLKLDVKIYEAGFFERISGLMFKKGFNYGLLINKTNSVHTCFMREKMDAIFLSGHNKVVKVYKNMKPWRITFPVFKAKKVLELPAGLSDKFLIEPGTKLEFTYV